MAIDEQRMSYGWDHAAEHTRATVAVEMREMIFFTVQVRLHVSNADKDRVLRGSEHTQWSVRSDEKGPCTGSFFAICERCVICP